MKEKIRYFYQQVRAKDGEHEQALLRVAFTFLIVAYLFFWFEPDANAPLLRRQELIFGVMYLIFSLCLTLHILIKQDVSRFRQWLAMFADIGAVTFEMLITQESSVLFYAIYLWVIVGNGLRYGPSLLAGAYVSSLVGFSLVIVLNGYWQANARVAAGLMITLMLIPLYMLKLRKQLSLAVARAEDASRAKGQFLAHMSHEMRTPLNGVVGVSDLLMETPLNEEQKELVTMLKSSSYLLLRLIENVLDLSKVESGKVVSEVVDFDLHEIVNNTVEMFSTQAEQKALRLNARYTSGTGFQLRGDALHLRQVFINLVGNAIKFTDKGMVEVRVSTVSQDQTAARLRFEVIDTGIGIAPEVQQKIFEGFRQADATVALKFGGTGLGTTISRQLVTLMGGEMGLQSEPGVGSIFWFELPFDKQQNSEISLSPTSLDQLQVVALGVKVSERIAIASHLAGWGVKFEYEASMARFLSGLRETGPEQRQAWVVLCAPQNLGLSAREFAAQVFASCPQKTPSLVLLGGQEDAFDEQEMLATGYSSLLRLPIDKTLLFNVLHGIMAPRAPEGVISIRKYFEQGGQEKRGLNILVAEDNGTNRKVISKMLGHGGYKVEFAEDGDQALDMLEQKHFDLMILDMNMPVLSGLEVVQIHRASVLRKPHIPAVILTANATIEAKRECEEAGVDAYLTKPVNAMTLLDTVARLTSTSKKVRIPEVEVDFMSRESTDGPVFLNENTLHHLSLLGRQDDFLQTVVHGFISETQKILDAMRIAVSNHNYDALKELAHMVKGSSGNVGAEALHEVCQEILLCDQDKLERTADELLRRANTSFKSTRVLLLQYLGGVNRISI